MQRYPFEIDAAVVLPEHLHCIWTLPAEDADYSMGWRLIKSFFSRHCPDEVRGEISASGRHKKEQAVWQRRFWEHCIRDQQDWVRHVEYIHYNPVRHRLVKAPRDWQYSSFHKYVREGKYDVMWGADTSLQIENEFE
ncbi:MAG: transposase [Aphanocapsa sp. GSE-SYN-MK-11-07L]|jgi:putative transposase|nr:transposase [Aphanocapsa sp. GSE-SYN-MK-11-07L]